MYNGGYGTNPSAFSIQNYAPIDPMTGLSGYQVPQAPQQIQNPQPNQGPTASSSAPSNIVNHNVQGAPARGSQSTNSVVGNPENVNTSFHHRVSTEQMRRDIERSAPYVPTPINNMTTGTGSSVLQPTQSASQQLPNSRNIAPSAAPKPSTSNHRANNQQQQPLAHLGVDPQTMPPQMTPMAMLFMQQQRHHQIANGQGNPNPDFQRIQSNSAQQLPQLPGQLVQRPGIPVGAVQQSRAPGPQTLPPGQPRASQLPPNAVPAQRETTQIWARPEIHVYNQGHPHCNNLIIVDNRFVNILDYMQYLCTSRFPLGESAAYQIRIRLPPDHPFHIAIEQSRPSIPNAPTKNARPQMVPTAAPPGPARHEPITSAQVVSKEAFSHVHGPHVVPPTTNVSAPPHQLQSGPLNLPPGSHMLPPQYQHMYPMNMVAMSRDDLEQRQRLHQHQIQQFQYHANLNEAQKQKILQEQQRIHEQQQREQQKIIHQQQQLQQHAQLLQQAKLQQKQTKTKQNQQRHHQQHQPQSHQQHQPRPHAQQQHQHAQQAEDGPADRPLQVDVASGSRVGISADEAAPPSAYTPTSSPRQASPIMEVKPPRITEKPPKKRKPIEVITLDDEMPIRVKSEPMDGEVSSTSDAAPIKNISLKQEPNQDADQGREAGNSRPRENQTGALQNIPIKMEPIDRARRIIERTTNGGQGSSCATRVSVPNPEEESGGHQNPQERVDEEERVQAKAIQLLRDIMKLPRELRPPEFRDIQESPTIQESNVSAVSAVDIKPVKASRSRSSSRGSEVIVMRKKKVIVDEESDDPYEVDQPSTSYGLPSHSTRNDIPVDSRPNTPSSQGTEHDHTSTSKNEASRREKRSVVYEESDDEGPVISKKKRKTRKSSEDEWRDDGNNSSEEELDDEDFIAPDDEDEEEDDDMRDFIVDDEEEVEYDSDEDRRRRRREKSKEKDPRKRPVRGRSPVRERTRSTDRSHSKRSEQVSRPKSVSDNPRSSGVNPRSPTQPMTKEEKRRLRNEKTRMTKEANREMERQKRLQQQNDMYNVLNRRMGEVSQASAIKEYHQSSKRDPPKSDNSGAHREKPRRKEPAPLNKRTTPSASVDFEDEGVHVPSKRMAHSNSVPGTSRDRQTAAPVRNRPSQNEIDRKRYSEAEAKKLKERKEYDELKNLKHPTEGQRMRLMQLRTVFEPKPSSRPTTSKHPTPNLMKTVKIKQELFSPTKKTPPPEPRPSTPPYLDPTQGRSFLAERKKGMSLLFKYLYDANKDTAHAEAQKIELELAKRYRDGAKFKTAIRLRSIQISRANTSGVLEVNPKAVSHSQILSGAPKENCLVAKGRKVHVDFRTLTIEQLQPLLIPFKMTDAELETNAYPLFHAGSRTVKIAETTYTLNKKMFLDSSDLTRSCSRCQKEFRLNPDGTMKREKDICRYHNRGTNRNGKKDTFQKRYTCCNEEYNSTPGCKFSNVHVFDQLFKRELNTFVAMPAPVSPNDPRSNKAYALDCEMVYTVSGPALARLTMVNMKKEKVLDLFIKPPTEVLDPNTEFSGLTMDDIQNAKDTMETCHQKLSKFINSETILIGHSLESDLKAMRIVHKSVIDTAILFRSSGDFKIALKNLSSKFLGKTIQGDNEDAVGHDSLEDANTCVDLIYHGLKNPECIVIRKLSS